MTYLDNKFKNNHNDDRFYNFKMQIFDQIKAYSQSYSDKIYRHSDNFD